MKGIILAGGTGTRLFPLTVVTNKHLVPVNNLPMIEYPLSRLRKLNPDSISIVTGGENFQDVARYLGTIHPDINFSFHIQLKAGGIAQALDLTKSSVKNDKLAVILGDNIFEDDFSEAYQRFENNDLGAMVFLKEAKYPQRFGVAEVRGDKVISIEEKPQFPKSNLVTTGFYLYDSTIFEKIQRLKPSKRGEYEITDVNNMYLEEGRLGYYQISGFWGEFTFHKEQNYLIEASFLKEEEKETPPKIYKGIFRFKF